MLAGILCGLTTMTGTSTVTSEQILAWASEIEDWWLQTVVLDSLKRIKNFDAIKSGRVEQKSNTKQTTKAQNQTKKHCIYCGSGHLCCQCLVYGRCLGSLGRPKTSKQCVEAMWTEGVHCTK